MIGYMGSLVELGEVMGAFKMDIGYSTVLGKYDTTGL